MISMRVSSSAILLFSAASMLKKKRLALSDVPGTAGQARALQQATWLQECHSAPSTVICDVEGTENSSKARVCAGIAIGTADAAVAARAAGLQGAGVVTAALPRADAAGYGGRAARRRLGPPPRLRILPAARRCLGVSGCTVTSCWRAPPLTNAGTRGRRPVFGALRAQPCQVSTRLLRRRIELERTAKILIRARHVSQAFARDATIEVGKCKGSVECQCLRKGLLRSTRLARIEVGIAQIVGNERIGRIKLERT